MNAVFIKKKEEQEDEEDESLLIKPDVSTSPATIIIPNNTK